MFAVECGWDTVLETGRLIDWLILQIMDMVWLINIAEVGIYFDIAETGYILVDL